MPLKFIFFGRECVERNVCIMMRIIIRALDMLENGEEKAAAARHNYLIIESFSHSENGMWYMFISIYAFKVVSA